MRLHMGLQLNVSVPFMRFVLGQSKQQKCLKEVIDVFLESV